MSLFACRTLLNSRHRQIVETICLCFSAVIARWKHCRQISFVFQTHEMKERTGSAGAFLFYGKKMDFQRSGSADAAVDDAEDQSQQRADAVHGFEFLFVRLAPIVFAVFLIGIVIAYQRNGKT